MDERVLLAVRDTSFRGADPAAPADHRALSVNAAPKRDPGQNARSPPC